MEYFLPDIWKKGGLWQISDFTDLSKDIIKTCLTNDLCNLQIRVVPMILCLPRYRYGS